MPQLRTIDPLPETSWVRLALCYALLAAPIVIIGVWLFQIQYTEHPTFWLLPAALAAIVWAILTYEAYRWR